MELVDSALYSLALLHPIFAMGTENCPPLPVRRSHHYVKHTILGVFVCQALPGQS